MEPELESDDETLRKLAAGWIVDYSTWPLLLEMVILRIEKIAKNDFPIPRLPEPGTDQAPAPSEPCFLAPLPSSDPADLPSTPVEIAASSTGSPPETNKENAAPTPSVSTPSPTPTAPPSAPPPPEPGALPPQIMAMIAEITGVLKESFGNYPPHTVQRLAELVLRPRQHYTSLPAYLHAIDRVVHVTSGNNVYPLPSPVSSVSAVLLSGPNDVMDQGQPYGNGADTTMAWVSTSNGSLLDSDEALGGALLTPIPWLQGRLNGNGGSESEESSTLDSEGGGPSPLAATSGPLATQQRSQPQTGRQFETRTESTETIDGPNGVGSIETVSISVNGILSIGPGHQQRVINQGELIRQEQRAGVVPVSQLQRHTSVVATALSPSAHSTNASTNDNSPVRFSFNGSVYTVMSECEASIDQTNETPDQEIADEEEVPHVRGPDTIGAADMGPQLPTSSTFSISSEGNVEIRGIDVEAAVGRKHMSSQTTAAATSAFSGDGRNMTPPSFEASSEECGEQAQCPGDDNKGKSSGAESLEKIEKGEKEHEIKLQGVGQNIALSSATSTLTSPPSSKRGYDDDANIEPVHPKRIKGVPENASGSAGAAHSSNTPKAVEASDEAEAKMSTAENTTNTEARTQPKKYGEGDMLFLDRGQTATTAASDEHPDVDSAA